MLLTKRRANPSLISSLVWTLSAGPDAAVAQARKAVEAVSVDGTSVNLNRHDMVDVTAPSYTPKSPDDRVFNSCGGPIDVRFSRLDSGNLLAQKVLIKELIAVCSAKSYPGIHDAEAIAQTGYIYVFPKSATGTDDRTEEIKPLTRIPVNVEISPKRSRSKWSRAGGLFAIRHLNAERRKTCLASRGLFLQSPSEAIEEMSFLAWILLGLVAGFIGSKIVNKRGEGFFLDILLGVVGAVVGGWLFNLFGASGVTGFNVYSLFVAVIGSVLFLMIYHALVRRT